MHRMLALTAVLALVPSAGAGARADDSDYRSEIDHLVYATPDLDLGVRSIERLLGVRATPGGQHPGFGTRNALVALGPSIYLEIIGPDPDQPKPVGPRRFRIDELKAPQVVAWVAKGTGLEQLMTRARRDGVALGDVIAGRRKRPDGVTLSWTYTDPNVVIEDRLIPYFIDWGTSPHPALTAAPGATLVSFRAEHPDAARVQKMLRDVGLHLPVTTGPNPTLIATIDSPKGRVELRRPNRF